MLRPKFGVGRVTPTHEPVPVEHPAGIFNYASVFSWLCGDRFLCHIQTDIQISPHLSLFTSCVVVLMHS